MSKLVSCKACDKDIAKGVKKCPDCGKDQRNWFMRHKIMTFIAGIILISILGSALSGAGSEEASTVSSENTTKAKAESEETVHKVGDTFTAKGDQLEISLTKFEEKDVVGDPDFLGKKVSDGGTFAAIQYTMKNVSEEPVGMFDYPSINLVDEKGTQYESDVDASGGYAVETDIDNSKILSDLNPDISVTATEVYEVSKDKFSQGKWYIQIGEDKVQIK